MTNENLARVISDEILKGFDSNIGIVFLDHSKSISHTESVEIQKNIEAIVKNEIHKNISDTPFLNYLTSLINKNSTEIKENLDYVATKILSGINNQVNVAINLEKLSPSESAKIKTKINLIIEKNIEENLKKYFFSK